MPFLMYAYNAILQQISLLESHRFDEINAGDSILQTFSKNFYNAVLC